MKELDKQPEDMEKNLELKPSDPISAGASGLALLYLQKTLDEGKSISIPSLDISIHPSDHEEQQEERAPSDTADVPD